MDNLTSSSNVGIFGRQLRVRRPSAFMPVIFNRMRGFRPIEDGQRVSRERLLLGLWPLLPSDLHWLDVSYRYNPDVAQNYCDTPYHSEEMNLGTIQCKIASGGCL